MIEMLHTSWTTLSSSPVLRWVVIFAVLNFLGTQVSFFRARKVQPGTFRWKQAATEAVLITIAGAFGAFFLAGFTAWLTHKGLVHVNPEPASWWVVLLEFGVFFVLFDTWFYWWHRLMHIEPIYTLVHRWHHVSLTPTVVSTLNVNPIESLINGGFVPLFTAAAFLLGTPLHQTSMPFIAGSGFLIGVWIHCGYEFLPRWWNKSWATKWFITATFHDQHHQFFRYNYGGFTTLWDRVCGTMRAKYEQDFENPRARKMEERRRQEKLAQKAASKAAPASSPAAETPSIA
jgi:sterol desaturase/sphingolipid hydroxylase (fatty acid hydroxylase superfamily)